MKELNITIANKQYKVYTAESEGEKEVGLQGVEVLPKDEGMLFIFDESDEVSFWMKDTEIALDIIFINEDMVVLSVHQGIPNTEDLITEQDVSFVLEVNKDSGIIPGDELEFSPNKQLSEDKMHVLDADGNSQMELEGGERIFSRKHTKTLIKFAKKASATQNENDYKALGKRAFKFLQEQTDNNPEYVQSKN